LREPEHPQGDSIAAHHSSSSSWQILHCLSSEDEDDDEDEEENEGEEGSEEEEEEESSCCSITSSPPQFLPIPCFLGCSIRYALLLLSLTLSLFSPWLPMVVFIYGRE
jgi:CRISPR/Cas system CMR subunit Cmr4 (Cas7 group RAMP superfamily)